MQRAVAGGGSLRAVFAQAPRELGAFRGIPIWDPTWTVIEIATGREVGTFDSEADVAFCLVFEKLGRDQVEVLCDASPMSSCTSWT